MSISGANFITAFIVLYLIYKIVWYIRKRGGFNKKQELLRFIFCLYAAGVIGVTLFPINYPPYVGFDVDFFIRINPLLFLRDPYIKETAINFAGNICMFVPLIPLCNLNRWKPGWRFPSALFMSILISCGIEGIQLMEDIAGVGIRMVDIDDVILNTIGGIIGYAAFIRFRKNCTRSETHQYIA